VVVVLAKRLLQLRKFTRKRSGWCQSPRPSAVPNYPKFFDAVRGYADTLHKFVHAQTQERFLGNASFRCTKGGFPAVRDGNVAWISKRNLDKREISCDGFVPVSIEPSDIVRYWGDHPPSVDAPIQVELFRRLPNVNFMLHTHAYLDGAPFTKEIVPCGALEEVQEILNFCQLDTKELKLNLLGHGSIVLGDTENGFDHLPFVARPIPERFELNA
jgi:hypothetical protein